MLPEGLCPPAARASTVLGKQPPPEQTLNEKVWNENAHLFLLQALFTFKGVQLLKRLNSDLSVGLMNIRHV